MAFEEKNVRDDYGALRELTEDYNSRLTPTAIIGDRVIIGFDPSEYAVALEAAGL